MNINYSGLSDQTPTLILTCLARIAPFSRPAADLPGVVLKVELVELQWCNQSLISFLVATDLSTDKHGAIAIKVGASFEIRQNSQLMSMVQ